MEDIIWFNVFDFNVFEKDSYPWQLINGGYAMPLNNIVWKVNNGSFVKKGECLFSCTIYSTYYSNSPEAVKELVKYGDILFNAPKDGFFYTRLLNFSSFNCQKNMELCAIYNTKEEYDTASVYDFSLTKNEYKSYTKIKTEYRKEIYAHPSIKTDATVKSIVKWLTENKDNTYGSYGWSEINGTDSTFYINEDLTIDVFADSFSTLIRNDESLPNYIQFNKINGDFSIYFYQTNNDNNITLKGCPRIVTGNFECSRCRLTKFEYMPEYIGRDCIAKTNNISSFVGMPKYIGGCFNIANNDFTDEAWEYAKENIDAEFRDYNISRNKFVKYRKELS